VIWSATRHYITLHHMQKIFRGLSKNRKEKLNHNRRI